MKLKILTQVGVALLLMVFSSGAVPLWPFMGWDSLTKRSPDIVIATCESTARWQTRDPNGTTEEIRDGLVHSDFEVVSVLKGGLTNEATITLMSRHRPRQTEDYLMFGHFDHGTFHAHEKYRIVPLGFGFHTNELTGKLLDEQVKAALLYRLQMLDQQLKEGQEEEQRLEAAFDTDIVFFTDDRFSSVNWDQKIEAAGKSKEGLPADQFPEGNWGMPTNGCQLSLRFDKATFSAGEPITATILFRNVSNKALQYKFAAVAGRDGPVDFSVRNQEGIVRPIPIDVVSEISARDDYLLPKLQRKYIEGLDQRYSLKKGVSYVVHASFKVNCPECFQVTSSDVEIKIVE